MASTVVPVSFVPIWRQCRAEPVLCAGPAPSLPSFVCRRALIIARCGGLVVFAIPVSIVLLRFAVLAEAALRPICAAPPEGSFRPCRPSATRAPPRLAGHLSAVGTSPPPWLKSRLWCGRAWTVAGGQARSVISALPATACPTSVGHLVSSRRYALVVTTSTRSATTAAACTHAVLLHGPNRRRALAEIPHRVAPCLPRTGLLSCLSCAFPVECQR